MTYRVGQKYLDKTQNDFNCQKSQLLHCEANGQWESHWIISPFNVYLKNVLNKTSSITFSWCWCFKFCLNTSAQLCMRGLYYELAKRKKRGGAASLKWKQWEDWVPVLSSHTALLSSIGVDFNKRTVTIHSYS